ncbi:presenilin [Natrinema caseinilyticum]|uniref:presenilin n=1 Tax=Natrinema caseinilyticum TaxID=2961570 RepID=UPI0020C57A6B|nr:presenilin [Natrinema caseinilyticum]
MSDPNGDDPRTSGGSETEPDTGAETGDAPIDRRDETVADIESEPGDDTLPSAGRDPRDEQTQIAIEERRRKTSVLSLLVAGLGGWVVLSVLVFEATAAPLWNDVLVGLVVLAASGYNYYRLTNDIPISTGIASLIAILGIWLIVSTALLGMTGGLFWSTLVAGLLITAVAGYNAYEAREARTVVTEPGPGA